MMMPLYLLFGYMHTQRHKRRRAVARKRRRRRKPLVVIPVARKTGIHDAVLQMEGVCLPVTRAWHLVGSHTEMITLT